MIEKIEFNVSGQSTTNIITGKNIYCIWKEVKKKISVFIG